MGSDEILDGSSAQCGQGQIVWCCVRKGDQKLHCTLGLPNSSGLFDLFPKREITSQAIFLVGGVMALRQLILPPVGLPHDIRVFAMPQ